MRIFIAFMLLIAPSSAHAEAPPLFSAVQRGDLTAVKSLVAAGTAVNDTYDGDTPLIYALRFSQSAIADYLCGNGAIGRRCTGYIPEATKALGECDANSTAKIPWNTCVRDTLAAGADPNFEFHSGRVKWLLNFAIALDNLEATRLLLAAGANIESRADSWGVGNNITALMEAAYSGDPEIVKLLLQKGANPNARDGDDYFSPLEVAVYKESPAPGPVVRLLVPVSSRETRNRLIAMMLRKPRYYVEFGVEKANEEIFPLLMEGVGADIDYCYSRTDNLLIRASRDIKKYEGRFHTLLSLGANPRGCNDGDLPMTYVAAWSNRLDLLSELIAKGAPATSEALINVLYYSWGSDPKSPSLATARFLLDHGADPQGPCNYACPDYGSPGNSALDWLIWKMLREGDGVKPSLAAVDLLLQYVTTPRPSAVWQVMERAGPHFDQMDHQIKPDPFAKMREEILERLLRFKGIELNTPISDGLHEDYFLVRAMGAPNLARMLVEAGESVEPPKYSLLWRWLTNYPGILSLDGYQYLLENGANPLRDRLIVCALTDQLRVSVESMQAFQLLVRYGLTAKFIDAAECGYYESWGPAITAATYNHFTKLVDGFLKLGVNPKLKSRNGKTALEIARAKKYQDLVELLERNGG